MKRKLLAAVVLFLTLGFNTTTAQNMQRSKERNQVTTHDRKGGGASVYGKKDRVKRDGKYRKADRKYRSGKMKKHGKRKHLRKAGRNKRMHRF